MQRGWVHISLSITLLVILAVAAFAGPKPGEATIDGTVSCSVAPPPKVSPTGPSDTVQDCLDRGGAVVIVEDGKDHGIAIDNPNAVKGYEGRRVSVSGYRKGDSFHVVSMRII